MSDFLRTKIKKRILSDSLRTLKINDSLIDFSSNDYLGFAKSVHLKNEIEEYLTQNPNYYLGATGSRLLSGNNIFTQELETYIANFYESEASLIFNSGYDANIGLMSSIGQKGDTFVCDELIHASLIDGIRLSNANKYIFKHNDLISLESKLKNSKGNIFIVTESVFSMDGDISPLKDICDLAKKYQANVIVDEAHATGVIGEYGKGLVAKLNLEKEVFARIHTFGKALGCHGAVVLGSNDLKTYLINFARSFIYTTALPFHTLLSVKFAFQELFKTKSIKLLKNRIQLFKDETKNSGINIIKSDSAIQCMVIPGNENCKKEAENLQHKGFDVRPILSPTVTGGKERLRICIHAYNSEQEIIKLVKNLKEI